MVLLQPKLNVKLSQKQILTPGLVQMVSVLALNKIELKDMINAEMMENPVLEELDSSVPLLDEVAGKEAERDRLAAGGGEEAAPEAEKKSDPFDEIDMGTYFNEYLDPGYRSPESEYAERPSFENFLSKPTTLTEHLMWQLGAVNVSPAVREAAELVIGNLNEDGYLIASDEELLAAAAGENVDSPEAVIDDEEEEKPKRGNGAANGEARTEPRAAAESGVPGYPFLKSMPDAADLADLDLVEPTASESIVDLAAVAEVAAATAEPLAEAEQQTAVEVAATAEPEVTAEAAHGPAKVLQFVRPAPFTLADLHEAIALVRQFDPVGVAARDLRECMLAQLEYLRLAHEDGRELGRGMNGDTEQTLAAAIVIVSSHLKEVQNKQLKEISKAIGQPVESVQRALDFLKTLDPKPGLRYNKVEARLIEPDVAFVKQGDDFLIVMNDEDVPQLRLSPTYKRLLHRDAADKDVRGYVKERYKSAIQLIKNIEQRKQTILKVCYAILGRQRDFLDRGIDQLRPMMIKEVAEEIGVHPSTVSRAVANKYAHTPQGVFELRYFFSESVQGPEGGGTSLLILKRRVKKLIEEEDPARPLTDEQITRILQSQGIQVTRRTVAKYREDMKIPSTHQRRVKN